MTTSSTARVACERPGRYGKQLASHFSAKLDTNWDAEEGRGYLRFDGDLAGTVELIAGEGVLLLQVDGAQDHIETLEEVVGRHLARFGARDGLVIEWHRPGGVRGTTQSAAAD